MEEGRRENGVMEKGEWRKEKGEGKNGERKME